MEVTKVHLLISYPCITLWPLYDWDESLFSLYWLSWSTWLIIRDLLTYLQLQTLLHTPVSHPIYSLLNNCTFMKRYSVLKYGNFEPVLLLGKIGSIFTTLTEPYRIYFPSFQIHSNRFSLPKSNIMITWLADCSNVPFQISQKVISNFVPEGWQSVLSSSDLKFSYPSSVIGSLRWYH